MSAFPGRTREYKLISLDRFDGDNLRSTAFVLSHAHSDHMRGLDSPKFKTRLQSDNRIKLYCSVITRKLLLVYYRFSWLEKHSVPLPYDVPTEIAIPNPDSSPPTSRLVVTLTPCGHCIGAVMVLLEGDNGTVLYTGDFRLDVGSAARLPSLHTPSGTVKEIISMYCDTTFFAPESRYICSREESETEIIRLIDEHLRKSVSHTVLLLCKAKIGYENVYVEIYKRLGTKVHVAAADMVFYRELIDVAQCVTSDGGAARVHACSRRIQVLDGICEEAAAKSRGSSLQMYRGAARCPMLLSHFGSRDGNSPAASCELLVIQLSTMWFVPGQVVVRSEDAIRLDARIGTAQPCSVTTWLNPCYVRVCYSFHSSASEVADFVSYVKPRQAYANVCPIGHTLEETNTRLAVLLRSRDGRGVLPAAELHWWWQALPEVVMPKRRFLDDFDVGVGRGASASSQLSERPKDSELLASSQTMPSGSSSAADQCSSQSTLLTSTPEIDLWSSSADSADDDCDAAGDAGHIPDVPLPQPTGQAPMEQQFCCADAGSWQPLVAMAAPQHIGISHVDNQHMLNRGDGRSSKRKKPFAEETTLDSTVDCAERQPKGLAVGNRTPTASDDEDDCVPPSPEAKSKRAIPSFLSLGSCLQRPR